MWSSPESITIPSLPAPLNTSMIATQDVDVYVALRFGISASSKNVFSWVIPPRSPVTPHLHPCSYRDEAGAAHMAALWPSDEDIVTQVNPVAAWIVRHHTELYISGDAVVIDVVPVSSSAALRHVDNSTVRGQLAALPSGEAQLPCAAGDTRLQPCGSRTRAIASPAVPGVPPNTASLADGRPLSLR